MPQAPVLHQTPQLSHDEAVLRIAFLVAHADGRQASVETAAISNILAERYSHMEPAHVARLAIEAMRDVSHSPTGEVLARVRDALSDRPSRLQALQVACEVANADRVLARPETEHMLLLIAALGLKAKEVQEVVRTYW